MNSKRTFINFIRHMAHSAVLVSVFVSAFSLLSVNVFAENSHYQFNKIAQLNHTQSEPSQWLQLVTHPNNIQQYFVINKTGQMYLVDNIQKPHLVLNLSVSHSEGPSPINLTAIELHPNFALRGQLGYRVFYTAHLEILDKKSRTKRIEHSDNRNELILKFDAVLTEWQFSSDDYQNVDLNTKREVLRIAVPDNTMTIKKMSFNPYTKSWNDDFGLLYIALNGQKKWQKPLFSGVILRINPAKFGLRSFTVPNNNPYLKESTINDEIYLLGGQNITQFIWPNKNSNDILLSHHYSGKYLLSLVNGQNDWRDDAPREIIYQGNNFIADTLLYRGSNLPYLRNKLLLLTQENQKWILESLNVTPSVYRNALLENKPQQEWQFTSQQLASNSEISFSTNRDGEVLVLDKTAGIIFQIFQGSSSKKISDKEQVITLETESTSRLYLIFLVMTAIGVVLYVFKRNKFSAKSVVRKQFAHIELSESQLQIGLYHRHQNSTDTIIDIIDIASCEVKLNNQTINFISQEAGHGFTDAKEQDLRNVFIKEQVDKMIDGKVRQVNLLLTDIHEKDYTICLYMRKGSDRVTKKTYSVVIDDLVDWCWLIAAIINSDETEKRKQEPVTLSGSVTGLTEKTHYEKPLHDQAAAIRSTTHDSLKTSHREALDLTDEPLVTTEEGESEKVAKPRSQNIVKSNTIDTELVDALEKLVNLKQQGFLTQEEFTKAKENLMRSLFEKSKK